MAVHQACLLHCQTGVSRTMMVAVPLCASSGKKARSVMNSEVQSPPSAFEAAWYGYAVMPERPVTIAAEHPELSAIGAGWQLELAGRGAENFEALARLLFGAAATCAPHDARPLEFHVHGDAEAGWHAIAAFADDRLFAALLVQRGPIADGRPWLAARFRTPLDPAERFRLFSGRPGGALTPRGAIVCFCCNVGHNEIVGLFAVSSG